MGLNWLGDDPINGPIRLHALFSHAGRFLFNQLKVTRFRKLTLDPILKLRRAASFSMRSNASIQDPLSSGPHLEWGIDYTLQRYLKVRRIWGNIVMICYILYIRHYAMTHWSHDKVADILQTFFLRFLCRSSVAFWFKLHCYLSLMVPLTVNQHWFRQWLGTEEAARNIPFVSRSAIIGTHWWKIVK